MDDMFHKQISAHIDEYEVLLPEEMMGTCAKIDDSRVGDCHVRANAEKLKIVIQRAMLRKDAWDKIHSK